MLRITTDWSRGLSDSMIVYPVESVKNANRIPITILRRRKEGAPYKEAAIFLLTKEQAEELVAELTIRLGELK